MSMYVCPKCGKKVWSEASQCMFCGTSIEDIIYYHKTGVFPNDTKSASEKETTKSDWLDPKRPLLNEYKKQMISSIILSLQCRSKIVLPKPTTSEQPKPKPQPQPQRRTTVKPNTIKPDTIKPAPHHPSPNTHRPTPTTHHPSPIIKVFKIASMVIGIIVVAIILTFGYFVMQVFNSLSHKDITINDKEIWVTYNNQIYKVPNPENVISENPYAQKNRYEWREQVLMMNDYGSPRMNCYTLSSTEKLGFDNQGYYHLTIIQEVDNSKSTYVTLTKYPNYNFRNRFLASNTYPYPEQYFTLNLNVIDESGTIHQFETKPDSNKGVAKIKDSKQFLKLINENKVLFFFIKNYKDERSHCFVINHSKGENDYIIEQIYEENN